MKIITKTIFKLFAVLLFAGFCFMPVVSGSSQVVYAEDGSIYKTVRASHILVDSEQDAWALKSKITEGACFEALAQKYSKCPSKDKGGDLGYFGRGAMVPEFEKAAFSTPQGEVSDPVQTRHGWHLIKVTRKMRG